MAHPFALQRLLDAAVAESEKAATALGQLNRQEQVEEQKLSLLLQYRKDYQERLRRASTEGLHSAGLRNFNDFLARLEQAIQQQRTVVEEARRHTEQGRGQWQTRQIKAKAFDTLSLRYATTATRIEMAREQKLQDDFASRGAQHKSLKAQP